MNRDGYTLAEALVAMLILGLAVGGLVAGSRAVASLQARAGRAAGETRELRAADRALAELLGERGPFRSDDPAGFTGEGARFSFDCGGPQRCGAALEDEGEGAFLAVAGPDGRASRLRLPRGARSARFVYGGDRGELAAWPPAGPRQVLRTVTLIAGDRDNGSPVATARLWLDQEPDCEYDAITLDCRRRGP
jgi:hypothetical protein